MSKYPKQFDNARRSHHTAADNGFPARFCLKGPGSLAGGDGVRHALYRRASKIRCDGSPDQGDNVTGYPSFVYCDSGASLRAVESRCNEPSPRRSHIPCAQFRYGHSFALVAARGRGVAAVLYIHQ
jgi:hypothetical protein